MYIGTEIIFILILLICSVGAGFAYSNHRRISELEKTQKKGVPYFWRNYLEDTIVPNIRTRDNLEALRTLVKSIEREIEDSYDELDVQAHLFEQYRNGTYDKDQPARERRSNTS